MANPCPIISRPWIEDFPLIGLPDDPLFHLLLPSSSGLMDAEVTQTARYLVKRRGEKIVMECSQDMGHDQMFWYRQDPGLGLRLLHFSYGVDSHEKGDFPDGYSVSRKKKEGFSLTLGSASSNQTAVYFCASSDPQRCIAPASLHKKEPGARGRDQTQG